jgi:hypothetical protein|tara:strand:- start:274 stop:552 length:279 start_codon:yes stop_codon:yes gene_type:complete
MKKLILLLLFISLLFSCSKDDLVEIKPVNQIVGKWHFNTYTIDNVDAVYDECKQKGCSLFYIINIKNNIVTNTPIREKIPVKRINPTFFNSQ